MQRRHRLATHRLRLYHEARPFIPPPLTPMSDYRFTDDAAELDFGVDAQTAGTELERIRVSYGCNSFTALTPKAVVEEARPEDAPLHPAFEWDNDTAAEKYREHQATNLIRRVRVVAAPAPKRQPIDRAHLEPEVIPDTLPTDAYDPLAWECNEAVSAVVAAKRMVEVLRQKAQARFDTPKRIAANVALADIEEAERELKDAHEALVASRLQSSWNRQTA